MTQFKEGEEVHIVTKWRDVRGKVNLRGEVAAVLGIVGYVMADGKTAAVTEGLKTYKLPLIEGFAFRDPQEALARTQACAEQYFDKDAPDPFEGQTIPS